MIYIILIFSAILRIIKIDQSLWWDEAINIVYAKNLPFWDFVTKYPIGDFHPPGYFAILWVWTHFFGFSEIASRIPSVIFGVGTVFLIYLLGKEVFNKKIGVIAALFMALSPLHVYYSQEARMYSLATFAVILSFYFLIKKNWLRFIFACILVLYSDYLPYLIFPAQLIYLIWCERNYLKKVFLLQVLSFIFLVPWLFIFPKQLTTGTTVAALLPEWSSIVGGANLKQLVLIPVKTAIGKISLDNKQVYYVLIYGILFIYSLILWSGLKKIDKATKLLGLWITIPVILTFIISFYIPVLAYFRLIFILPAFYLLLAKGVLALPKRLIFPAISLISIISLISLIFYYTNPKFQRENWKEAVLQVEQKASMGGIILFEDNNLPAPFLYYSQNKVLAQAGLKNLNLDKKDIYLFEYLVDINDPKRLLEKQIKNSGFQEIEILNFDGVGFVRHFRLQ